MTDARIFVEGWDPSYGTSLDLDESLAAAEGSVDTTVEDRAWEPVEGRDDDVERIAFVDGVRRVDARLTLDATGESPGQGLVGSFAVGATLWDRTVPRSEVVEALVERWAIIGAGRSEAFPAVDLAPPVRTTATASPDPEALVMELHARMRRAEGTCARTLAETCAVVADGPLSELATTPHPVIGYVKSHRRTYLDSDHGAVIAHLAPGQRTPLFLVTPPGKGEFARYSWYLRLTMLAGGHSWTGIVRCEAWGRVPLAEVVTIADRTAAVLPIVSSQPHVDPRAPQNLVPIAALERELRHLLGDRGLVERGLREAVAGMAA